MSRRIVLGPGGNTGKTTFCVHVLAPRMKGAPLFAVETLNETAANFGIEIEKFKGEQYRDLYKKLMLIDDAIIDVGASNISGFLDGLMKFEDSAVEMDAFYLPTTSGAKEQKETIVMVQTLVDLGVPPEKIFVVFNRVQDNAETEFAPILNFVKREHLCSADPDTSIFENELFDQLAIKRMTIDELLRDETDYRQKAREAAQNGDAKGANHFAELHAMKGLAKTVKRNMDTVWEALSRREPIHAGA